MRRIFFVMWKEVIELRQDPRIFGIIFIAPVVQLAILGYAATTDVRNVPIVIVDADRSCGQPGADQPVHGLRHLRARRRRVRARDVDRYLESGDAWMALAIPARTARTSRRAARRRCRSSRTDRTRAPRTSRWGMRRISIAGYAQDLVERAARAAGGAAGWRRGGHRAARARLVQPDAREPLLHAARASSRCCCWS